jgi:hypothetical protein
LPALRRVCAPQVSCLLAWLSSEVGEPLRVPLVLYLTPKLRRRIDKWRAPSPPT